MALPELERGGCGGIATPQFRQGPKGNKTVAKTLPGMDFPCKSTPASPPTRICRRVGVYIAGHDSARERRYLKALDQVVDPESGAHRGAAGMIQGMGGQEARCRLVLEVAGGANASPKHCARCARPGFRA